MPQSVRVVRAMAVFAYAGRALMWAAGCRAVSHATASGVTFLHKNGNPDTGWHSDISFVEQQLQHNTRCNIGHIETSAISH